MPEVLNDVIGPSLPPHTQRAWTAFRELKKRCDVGQAGIGRIKYSEIEAYERVEHHYLTPLDKACIAAADDVVTALQYEQLRTAAKSAAKNDAPPVAPESAPEMGQ